MPETRNIKTAIKGQDEAFRILAIAEATGFPVLFVGPPGVGKTEILLDYGKAKLGKDDLKEDKFILETNPETKSVEVTGRVDMKHYTEHKEFKINAPITRAKLILTNEIDKASPSIKHALYSVMNEKQLYTGNDIFDCQWELFCASCNEIPKDDDAEAFWDRFVIKHEVKKLSKESMVRFIQSGIKEEKDIEVQVPSKEEVKEMQDSIDPKDLAKVIEACHDQLSNRSASHIPKLAAACSYVFDQDIKSSLVRAVMVLCGHAVANQVSQAIEHQAISDARTRIQQIKGHERKSDIQEELKTIRGKIQEAKKDDVPQSTRQEILDQVQRIIDEHPVLQEDDEQEGEEEQQGDDEGPQAQAGVSSPTGP